MPTDQASDIRLRLWSLANDLSQGAHDEDSSLIVRDAVAEIEILRAEVAAAERKVDALARLAWLPPVRKADGSPWADGEWRSGRREGDADTLEAARRGLLEAAGEED